MSRTMPAMPASSTLITPSGPSSLGVVLMLKREGAFSWSSRVPIASGGCSDVSRAATTGRRLCAVSRERPGARRAMTFRV